MRHIDIADLSVRRRDIILPKRIVGVRFRQALVDGEAGLVRFESCGQVALGHEDVADLLVRHRHVAGEFGVAGIGLCQSSQPLESSPVQLEGLLQMALCEQDIGDAARGDLVPAMPNRIARIRDRQLLQDLETRLEGLQRLRQPILLDQRVTDFPVSDRESILPVRLLWVRLRQSLDHIEARLIRLERAGQVALSVQHVAHRGVGRGQIPLELRAAGVLLQEVLQNSLRLLRRVASALRVAEREERFRYFVQCCALAVAESGSGFARAVELVLQLTRAVENVLDGGRRNADDVPELLREIEYEAVGGTRCQRQRMLGTVTLRLRLAAADLGENRKTDCDDGNSQRAANPIALPHGRGTPARADEILMQIGRCIGIGRTPIEPALGRVEVGATQGRASAALLLVPVPCELAETSVLAHPGQVGMQRRVERRQCGILVVALGAEHPVQPAKRRWRVGIGDAARHDGNQSLAEPRALLELPRADSRCDQIRTDREHHGIGRGN